MYRAWASKRACSWMSSSCKDTWFTSWAAMYQCHQPQVAGSPIAMCLPSKRNKGPSEFRTMTAGISGRTSSSGAVHDTMGSAAACTRASFAPANVDEKVSLRESMMMTARAFWNWALVICSSTTVKSLPSLLPMIASQEPKLQPSQAPVPSPQRGSLLAPRPPLHRRQTPRCRRWQCSLWG